MTDNDVVIVIDTSKCIGCKSCQIACQQWNGRPAEDTDFTGSYQNPPDLSGANLNIVKFFEIEEPGGKVQWHFMADRCRHCDIPLCKPACPKLAIVKHNLGAVWIDETKCIPSGPGNCTGNDNAPDSQLRPCQNACPYKISGDGIGVPRWQYMKNGSLVIEPKMKKCTFCYNRFLNSQLHEGTFANSKRPACALACPTGAIQVNRLGAMKSIVIARLAVLKANGYPNAIVYPYQWPGAKTHVNWILTEHPTTYGLTF
jgi:formate dehydrogenase iron-sulfur subunit